MIGKRVLGGFVKESKSKGAKTADIERTILDGISPALLAVAVMKQTYRLFRAASDGDKNVIAATLLRRSTESD